MTLAVCFVKSVPIGGQFLRPVDGTLVRDGVAHGIDPVNELAVEWALLAREAGAVDEVMAVAMGPADAEDALRRALAMGCDRVLRVADDRLAGATVGLTAEVLAAAARLVGARLALFGNESLDGSSGMVPSAVAAHLGWPLVSLARTAAVVGGQVEAARDMGTGPEEVRAPLPAVVSFSPGCLEPRYPSIKELLAARRTPLDVVDLDGLGLGPPPVPDVEHDSRLVELPVVEKAQRRLASVDEAVPELLALVEAAVPSR